MVVYSSSGPVYFSSWLDGQTGCSVLGLPGCYGWQATPSADGQPHWLYPEAADAEYQSNLTALDATPPTNVTGQQYYLNNIESLNAEYLPLIMVAYPDQIQAYNIQHWTDWPSFMFKVIAFNVTMFVALQPASTARSNTDLTSAASSATSATTTATSSTGHGITSTTSVGTSRTVQSSSTTPATNTGTLELIAGIIIVIIIIGGVAAYMMRRRPAAT
ncbi:MAG: hypothetical protein ACREBS_07390 [Nitrososphaerales archaeon]